MIYIKSLESYITLNGKKSGGRSAQALSTTAILKLGEFRSEIQKFHKFLQLIFMNKNFELISPLDKPNLYQIMYV